MNFDPDIAKTKLLAAPPGASISGLQGAPPASESKGISHAKLAWSHKILLLAFLVLGTVGGTLYVMFSTPVYQSAGTVELVGFNQAFMNMSMVDPQSGTDALTASISNVQTQIRLLTSRTIIRRTAQRVSLEMPPVASAPSTSLTRLRNRIPFLRQQPPPADARRHPPGGADRHADGSGVHAPDPDYVPIHFARSGGEFH